MYKSTTRFWPFVLFLKFNNFDKTREVGIMFYTIHEDIFQQKIGWAFRVELWKLVCGFGWRVPV